ncbi:MAG: UDP-N-acetylglucosamine diphosphorylase [Puniceicoccales bacterium]|jgi:NDP-sugar pyrophosphorylase family protein|nr:UDP-N-acetylglucosamine diphosphorylase [Puniceicoccales bacterium]
MKAKDFFQFPENFGHFREYFSLDQAPWEWLVMIKIALEEKNLANQPLGVYGGVSLGRNVYIHPSVRLPHFATLGDNVFIDEGTELRPGAYIRDNVILGRGCVIGNSCELKNSILMDYVQIPHFNYVGDSIIGNYCHLGAGAVLANLRLDKKCVNVLEKSTGLRKFGAILGDHAQVGCNSVLNPGSILHKNAMVSASMAFSGVLARNKLAFVDRTGLLVIRDIKNDD